MRVFKEFNQTTDDVCPVCGTNENKEVVLVIIDGTQRGNISQCKQVHLDCIDLRLIKLESDQQLIYQKFAAKD